MAETPFQVQRFPLGLGAVLNLVGGQAPNYLDKELQGILDLLQFYGSTQLQVRSATNAALAQGGAVTVSVPQNETWLLFSAGILAARTATMTAMAVSIGVGPTGSDVSVIAGNASPYAATALGAFRLGWAAPYPRLLLPGHAVSGRLDSLGTDATANMAITVCVGVLGQ